MTPQLNKTVRGFEKRDNTLARDVKDTPADRITLEIGDSKQPQEFLPQAKVMRWDNEVNLSVRRQKPRKTPKRGPVRQRARVPTADVQGDRVIYDDDDETVHIYERPEVGEDGGLEIELHLKHKPTTNRFDFSIQTKGLNFYYQPALTEEEIAEGVQRPENVVGSYAVYHATKRDNRVGGKEYKTGKFCHIYRPHITDADGNETWGELELDEQSGLLTVVVPEAFLDKAVYPVVVDPTFGYTSIGSNAFSAQGGVILYLNPTESGNITDAHVYFFSGSATDGAFGLSKSKDDGNDLSLSGNQTVAFYQNTSTFSVGTGQGWVSNPISSAIDLTRNLGVCFAQSPKNKTIKFDTGGPFSSGFQGTFSTSFPDAYFNGSSNTFSIYATYTASAPTVTTQAVNSIGETTATGNGNVTDDSGFTITERGVCWSTSPVPTTADSKATSAGTTGAFTASITGLSPDTTYYVRAYAVNSEGTGYGAEVSFTTLPVQAPSVSTDAVSAIGETTATGNGEITNVNGNDATERGFVYDTVSRVKPAGGAVTLLDSESFESNLGDWSNAAGNDIDWTRNSGGTPSSSTGPSSAQDGSYYIYIETTSRFGNEVSIIEYNIGEVIDGYVDFYYHQYGDDQGTLYLEGWDGSTWTTIWSSTGDQGNQWNNVGQAATEFSGYSKLRFRNVHDAGGSFNGDIALDNINVYEVDPTPSPAASDYTSLQNETGSFGAEAYSLELSGLTGSTTYYVRAYAKNSAGYSYSDTEVSFTTTSGVTTSPPTVTTQAVSSIGETTATGNGNVTDDGGATITERGVCWSTSTGPTTADSKATSAGTTGAFTASMTGLTANTTYYVRAYAINSEGTSYGSEVTFTTTAAPEPGTCLPGYTYRKKITIAGQSGAGTDYQVKLLIGDTTGGDFNLGGNSANFPTGVNDGGDLTFTNEDSTVEYSFWVESVSGGVAEVWVKVGANLDTDQDIYIQYGNASASNKSDGEATFEFFDDFADGVIDTNKWVKEAENGSITESGGYLRVGGGIQNGAYGWSSLGSSPGYTAFNDNALMVRTRNSPNAIAEMAFRGDFAANNGYKMRSDARSGKGYATLDNPYSGWGLVCSPDGTNITVDQWYTMEIVALGGTVTAFRDSTFQAGTQVENCSGLTYQTAGQISLQNHFGDHADYDWVAVRKINATEPSFSSVGSEESCASGYDPLSIKVGGTFQTVTPKIKVGGTFVEKSAKIKSGGSF